VDIPSCSLHHPLINRAAREIKGMIRSLGLAPYSDEAHAGLLRYLQLVVERESQRLQVTVVCNEPEPERSRPLFERIESELHDVLHSTFFNAHTERSNAVLGPTFQRLSGPPTIREHFGSVETHFPPGAFGQSHLPLYTRIVERLHADVDAAASELDGSRVVELYAGTGAIGLGLLARGHQVVFNEIGSGSLAGLELGLQAFEASARARAQVRPGDADQVASELVEPSDVVIVDPPRKGLGPGVQKALLETPPARLFYLSCGLDSFLRDAAALGPEFELRQLAAYDLFPFTEHIETLGYFQRRLRSS
jgi:23S rRNA (uracil1939-C5)-methyltransferase